MSSNPIQSTWQLKAAKCMKHLCCSLQLHVIYSYFCIIMFSCLVCICKYSYILYRDISGLCKELYKLTTTTILIWYKMYVLETLSQDMIFIYKRTFCLIKNNNNEITQKNWQSTTFKKQLACNSVNGKQSRIQL